jgi:hypothetical protein
MTPKRGVGKTHEEIQPAWNHQRFEELVAFQGEHGHCSIPRRHPLQPWVDRVRVAYNDLQEGIVATITEEQIARLTAIGFDFSEKKSGRGQRRKRPC